jgi:hypothetical protein
VVGEAILLTSYMSVAFPYTYEGKLHSMQLDINLVGGHIAWPTLILFCQEPI